MNNRHRVLLGLVLTLGLALGAQAQTTVPPAWKTAASLDATQADTITKFVQENVAALENADPEVVRQAREAVIERTAKPMGADLSVAFAMKYAEAVNAEALALLGRAQTIRPKLNAAIVVARVAENTHSAKLEPAVLKLLADEQPESLKLWGVRGARSIVPGLITLNAEGKALAGITNAVKAHPTGAMTQEAYAALTGDADPKVAAKVIEPMLGLLKARVDVLASKLPEDPGAEALVFVYLTNPKVWSELPPPQRVAIMQFMADAIVLTARHGDAAAMEIRQEVVGAINRMAQGGMVVFQLANFQPAVLEFQKIYNGTRSASGIKLVELTKDLHAKIRQAPGFESIKDAPAPKAP